MALYFFGVASFSLLVLLNLFISVFVCVYLAQSREQAEARHKGVHGLVKLLVTPHPPSLSPTACLPESVAVLS
jgi:hypothetical protein